MINLILNLILICIGIFSIISIFTLIKTSFNFKKLDELQKKAVYGALSTSFLIVLGLHLVQLIASVFAPEPFSIFAKVVISPGGYDSAVFTNSSLNFDSFMIDSLILGVVYYVKRKKYGLI